VTPYVGAFWKSDQTGERLIRFAPTAAYGDWTAQVVEGEDWIVLDKKMTSDPNVGWRKDVTPTEALVDNGNDTDFETEHQVTAGDWWVKGTSDENNDVYFRIGLKSTLPGGATAAPRYGVVLLTYADNSISQRIWIRQGESDDYLMRNEDPTANAAFPTRTEARPFSPYNLTTSATMPAQVAPNGIGDNPAVFTDYPSQAGALWQWGTASDGVGLRYAWPPIGDPQASWPWSNINYSLDGFAGSYVGGTNAAIRYPWADIAAENEVCPAGYRRATDSGSVSSAINSEFRQSLSWHCTANDRNDNLAWGYYADGWFDRRAITTLKSVADSDQHGVAYVGQLRYNPYTQASVFFPAAGTRDPAGKLGTTYSPRGTAGIYHTASYNIIRFALRDPKAAAVFFNNGSGDGGSAEAHSVRCVKAE
jgi:hypothetical protein